MSPADEIWNLLRERCCATKPSTDAKVVVMVRKADIESVMQSVEDRLQREHDEFWRQLDEMAKQPPTPALVALMRSVPPWQELK